MERDHHFMTCLIDNKKSLILNIFRVVFEINLWEFLSGIRLNCKVGANLSNSVNIPHFQDHLLLSIYSQICINLNLFYKNKFNSISSRIWKKRKKKFIFIFLQFKRSIKVNLIDNNI
jgi:hypothetical protein